MPNLASTCAIAVMAKAPRPGHVKTRLQGLLTADEAAALGAAFLTDTTTNLAAAARIAPIHPYVAYAPAGQEARFDGLLAPGTRLILADGVTAPPPDSPGVEGFGRILLHAVTGLFALGYGAVALLSADSPTIPTAWLVHAAQRILAPGARTVLGPAEDGGYWLIALQTPAPMLFARIAWSSDTVAAATIARAAEIPLPLETLGTWFDVDDRDSLARLMDPYAAEPYAAEPFAAPATMALIGQFGLNDRLSAAV